MSKTLYVSDLDGTLLNGESRLSEKTKVILNQLCDRNVMFTYATARSYSSASIIVKDLRLCIPAITYNGTFFVDQKDGTIIHANIFTKEEVGYILDIIGKQKENIPLVYSLIDGVERVSYLAGSETEGIKHYLQMRYGDKRLRKARSIHELYQGDIFYFTFIGVENSLIVLKKALVNGCDHENPFFNHTFQEELYRPGEYWLELMPPLATKAAGAMRLKELTGCDRIVCFGDAINDIPLFQVADEAYAVANAVPELKRIATGVIGYNDEDGVALWMQEHV